MPPDELKFFKKIKLGGKSTEILRKVKRFKTKVITSIIMSNLWPNWQYFTHISTA
jgi:hypothetical protein